MRKKLFSLLVVLFVAATAFATFVIIKKDGTLVRINVDQLNFEQDGTAFKLNGVDVKDISNVFNKTWNKFDDYERAFTQEYLPSSYYAYPRNQQVTSMQFKELLKDIVEKIAPDSLPYFNSRVSDYNTPVTRGMAAMMAYYVARCIGATESNSRSNHSMEEHFWDDVWGPGLDQVLPYAHEPSPDQKDGWQESICALIWDDGHVSLISNKEVIEYINGTECYGWGKPFVWEDAVRAVTRLYDSREEAKPKMVYVSVDDPRATSPDSTVITPELLAFAAKKEVKSFDDLPRLLGMPIRLMEPKPDNDGSSLLYGARRDVEELGEWGFNSVSFRTPYWFFITDDLQANLTMLKALDEMIAACLEYDMHFNFTLTDVPGRGMKLQDDVGKDYIVDNDILNPEKRAKARKIWNTLATRYKDVPNRNLSFTTICELQIMLDPTIWGEGQGFTVDDVYDFQDFLFDAVREVDPDRFIYYLLLDNISPSYISSDVEMRAKEYFPQFEHVTKKYENMRPMINAMDMPFAFYSYNNGDGNIDYARHSCWVPQYPVTLYDADKYISNGEKLSFDGCLPKGTKFELFLASAAGKVTASVDGNTVYEEDFGDGQHFNVGYAASWGHPYAKSDKKIAFELTEDAKLVTIAAETGNYQWSGIAVTLPESYSVQKWRHDEQWDVELGILKPEEYHAGLYLQTTSTLEIPPTGGAGRNITILDNVTYTTDQIWIASNADVYEQYCTILKKYFGRWGQRIENVAYGDQDSFLRYFGDLARIYQEQNIDIWLPVCGQLYEEDAATFTVAGYRGVDFEGHHNFNLELLRVLQKYQDK